MNWAACTGTVMYYGRQIVTDIFERYLQHLANTRLQHLERIRTFTNRRLARSSKLSSGQKEAFSSSLAYLDFAELEASAVLSFADGLSSVSKSKTIRTSVSLTAMISCTPYLHTSLYCRTLMDPSHTALPPFATLSVCGHSCLYLSLRCHHM